MFIVNNIEIYIAYTLLFRNQKGFCQNFSLLTLMVKKLKISTLDGAETNSKTHTTLLIPDNQSIGCINFNSINYRNLTRARMKTTVLLIKMKKIWKGLIFLEGPKSHLGSILSCFRPIFFGKIKNPRFRKNLLLCHAGSSL